MTRLAERLCFVAAVGIAACFLAGISGRGSPAGGHRPSLPAADRFHEGKPVGKAIRDSRCQAGTCHGEYPHEHGSESAFRNMHVEFVECPVCHGPEEGTLWTSEPGPEGRWLLRTEWRKKVSRDPHPAFGPPVRCRGCHSEQGRKRIGPRNGEPRKDVFEDPVPLRMLEEGSRKWIPDGM